MSEIIFEVREDEVDGGYTANALGHGIHTQGDTVEEVRAMVRDAVHCYFDEATETPKIIRLHFVADELADSLELRNPEVKTAIEASRKQSAAGKTRPARFLLSELKWIAVRKMA